MSVAPPSRRLALLLGSVCVLSVLFASPLVRAFGVPAPMSSLIFEENFTSDNSTGGRTAATQSQLSARGWKDGVSSIGTGYKFETDSTLGKPVIYAHWSTTSAGGGDPKQPDGDASAIKRFFPASREVTMYALVKFHNVAGSANGAHWIRFFNNPSFGDYSPANMNGQMDLDVSGRSQNSWLYDPTTKQALPSPATQTKGFFLYSGGSLSYATKGRDNLWQDDIWYEVVWYLKNSTTGTGPQGTGDGQMRVYVRPHGTTAWVSAFDGANFVNTLYPGANISAWMIGPYMSGGGAADRWTNDIRHYFSRVAVWAGDAYSDGTLAAFLGTPQADTTPPTVSMTAPSAGSTVSGTVTVSANATDNVDVTSVQFQLNGANLGSQITSGTDSVSWNTTSAADGGYTLTAIARDAAGNTTTSAPLNVTVKNAVAPQISGVSTSNVSTSSATIGWQTDQAADTQVEYGPTTSYGSQSPLNTSMVSVHSASLSGLSGSTTYHFRVKSKNSSNMMRMSGDYSLVTAAGPDTTAPTVTITSPANGASVQVGQSVTLTMSATDNVGVTSSGFKVGGLAVTSPVSFSTAGAVTIVASASDAAGNAGTASVTINVVAAPPPSSSDTTAPTVTITSPANGASVQVGQSVTLTMSATDNVGVTSSGFKVGGLAVTSPVSFSTAGAVTIVASASDAAGNVGTASVTINVVAAPTSTAPVISSVTASSITTSGAVISWQTDQSSDTQVQYGTTTNYGSQTYLNTTMVSSHSRTLSGLSAGTMYHYRVKSKNSSGVLATSGDVTFTTSAASPSTTFTISNVATTKVNTTTYAMTWTTSVGATGRVEYGTTTSYGQFSALDPDMETSHYEEIYNLRSYTTYHYRVISTNAQGQTVVSGDRTFTTGGSWWGRW